MTATDRITLTGISGYGYHGVLESEKATGQTFVVDAVLVMDLAPAAASDDLRLTAHYGLIAELIHQEIESRPVDLIETLADRTARRILEEYPPITAVELTVHKPQAPIAVAFTSVAVTVNRERGS